MPSPSAPTMGNLGRRQRHYVGCSSAGNIHHARGERPGSHRHRNHPRHRDAADSRHHYHHQRPGRRATPFTYTAKAGDTVGNLIAAINAAAGSTLSAGTTASVNTAGQLQIKNALDTGITATSTDSVIGAMTGATTTSNSSTVFISDGSTVRARPTSISPPRSTRYRPPH